jgi:SH3 domain protein
MIIKQLRQENSRLKSTIQDLEKRYEETFSNEEDITKKLNDELLQLKSQNQGLLKSLNESNQQLIEVTQAYETLKENSQDIVEITQERDELKRTHGELSNSVERLNNDNNELKQKQTIRWFLSGSGVLLLGWILGKISRQRRRSSL